MGMTDPSVALDLFQESFAKGLIPIQMGTFDPKIFVCADKPNGKTRYGYLRLDRKTISALVLFANCDPINGIPCFNIGYAVKKEYRGKGIGKAAINSAIQELKNGLSSIGPFYIEAIIGEDNDVSNHLAKSLISNRPTKVTDSVSGLPAFRYVQKIG